MFVSCNTKLKPDKELTQKIENLYAEEKKPVDLEKITNFQWDKYLIIGPYRPIEEIEHTTGLNLENIYGNAIEFSDSMTLLIFIKNNKSIKICELTRKFELSQEKRLIVK